MALFPNLRELFGTAAPPAPMSSQQRQIADQTVATTPQQGAGQQGNGATGNGGENGNTTVPTTSTVTPDGSHPAFPATGKDGEASPLSGYKDMWEAADSGVSAATLVPNLVADPAAMMTAAKTFDFARTMDPEAVTKALQGDAASFGAVINSAVQAAFAQATTTSVNITKAALTEQAKQFETKYAPQMMRNAGIQDEVQAGISLAQDPAAAPIVNALTTQLSRKFPTATPAEIKTHVDNYMQEFAQKVVTGNGGRIQTAKDLAPRPGQLSRVETDWEKFFEFDGNTMQ